MIHKKVEMREVETVEDVVCNKCGQSCRIGEPGARLFNYGGLTGHVSGCYGSTHLEDGVQYRFDLCEKCVKDLFSTFQISAEETDGPWG